MDAVIDLTKDDDGDTGGDYEAGNECEDMGDTERPQKFVKLEECKRYAFACLIIMVFVYIIMYLLRSQHLYNGVFPMYDTYDDIMKPTEVFDAILNTNCSSSSVCTRKPVGVNDSAVFLVDTTKLKHQDDLRADDMGSWMHKGKPVRFYKVKRLSSGEVYDAQQCDKTDRNVYKLTRIYYHHKGTPEFRKTLFYVHGKPLTV